MRSLATSTFKAAGPLRNCQQLSPVKEREFHMKRQDDGIGTINTQEAYSKQEILRRLGVSQKVWDKMLDDGLLFTDVGHQRWVTGMAVIEHLSRQAKRKSEKHETETTK